MATKGKRKKQAAENKAKRKADMVRSGEKSNYARKKKWLAGSEFAFGFEVPYPKPWGGATVDANSPMRTERICNAVIDVAKIQKSIDERNARRGS